MARGDRMNAAIRTRILTSGQSLTVHYPLVVAPATGTAPGPAPLRPLTGTPATPKLIDNTVGTPSKPPKTMPCLWADAFYTVKTRAASALSGGARDFGRVGWIEGAEAMARVLLEDVAQDPADPTGPTVFSEISYVEFQGRHYKVMGQDRIAAGFRDPISMYVWLMGAEGQ